jgi:hypothetical protein
MEDILASIRRILNEDEAPPPATPAEPEPFALTEAMLVGADAPAAVAAPAEPPPLPVNEPPPAEPPPPPVEAAAPPAPPPEPEPEPMTEPVPPPAAAPPEPDTTNLLAPAAAAAAAASVGSLLRAVSADRHTAVHRGGGPTLEDLVREEMRPLLKAWLDEHLPPMVERLVRTEIERVVGRALS